MLNDATCFETVYIALCVRIVVSKSVNYYNTRKTTMEALKNGIQQRIEIGYHRKDVAA